MKRLVLVPTTILFISCVSATPAGELVRVTANPDAVRNCTLIGEVKGAEYMWGGALGQGIAENNAYKELKNRTAAMGGNTVLMVTSSTGFSGSVQRGEAYRCEPLQASAERQAAIEKVHVFDFVRRSRSDARLVGSFTITNGNDFPISSVVVHCEVAGTGGDSPTKLALGAHQTIKINDVEFSGDGIPDGSPVCRVSYLNIAR